MRNLVLQSGSITFHMPTAQPEFGDVWEDLGKAFSDFADAVSDTWDKVGPYIKLVLQAIGVVASFIPGWGTAVSMAISAGIALADGKPIDDALVDGVIGAVPGGPLVQTAVRFGYHALKGERLDLALINSLPIPDLAKSALSGCMVAVVAMARGEDVGDALVDGLMTALPPAARSAVFLVEGIANGTSSLPEVVKQMQDIVQLGRMMYDHANNIGGSNTLGAAAGNSGGTSAQAAASIPDAASALAFLGKSGGKLKIGAGEEHEEKYTEMIVGNIPKVNGQPYSQASTVSSMTMAAYLDPGQYAGLSVGISLGTAASTREFRKKLLGSLAFKPGTSQALARDVAQIVQNFGNIKLVDNRTALQKANDAKVKAITKAVGTDVTNAKLLSSASGVAAFVQSQLINANVTKMTGTPPVAANLGKGATGNYLDDNAKLDDAGRIAKIGYDTTLINPYLKEGRKLFVGSVLKGYDMGIGASSGTQLTADTSKARGLAPQDGKNAFDLAVYFHVGFVQHEGDAPSDLTVLEQFAYYAVVGMPGSNPDLKQAAMVPIANNPAARRGADAGVRAVKRSKMNWFEKILNTLGIYEG